MTNQAFTENPAFSSHTRNPIESGIIKPVAERYCIPVTSGRGFASLPPRADMVRRYLASGKEKLIVLIISDHDPDGEAIAHSFARSLRDDFGVGSVHAVRVALTAEQVERYALPPALKAKQGSATYATFVERHGENVYEVEALSPATLQSELEAAIDSVLDIAAFDGELDREREDATYLEGKRRTVTNALQGLIDAA